MEQQLKEEKELELMEFEIEVDKKEMEEFEEALLSPNEESEEEEDQYDDSNVEYLVDSPYPSDCEDDDSDYVITDRLKEHSSESVVPVAEITAKLQNLRSTDSSPSRPRDSSTPMDTGMSQTGQILVSKGCVGHCTCLTCTKCVYCAACEECDKCKKCQVCKYPPRQLKELV